MGIYKVKVQTGDALTASTFDRVSITMVGTKAESAKWPLDNPGKDFMPGHTDEYDIEEKNHLGEIILIRLHKEPYMFFPENSWYCCQVTVETPTGAIYHFPCYSWIDGYRTIVLPEGTAKIPADRQSPLLLKQVEDELKEKQNNLVWKDYQPGFPKCIDQADLSELNSDAKYSFTRSLHFDMMSAISHLELAIKSFTHKEESWESFDDLKKLLRVHTTDASEYVHEHWKEDSFFGCQFLNGVDPNVIKKCDKIPDNFPVTDEMVAHNLGASKSLATELKNGNLFIVDYKIMDGIPGNVVKGEQQYVAAPLCLLHLTPEDTLVPLAIQIDQTPGPENPIFLPSDGEWDWIFAKMWVQNTYFTYQQAVSYLLRTNFFAEVFCIATLRQLPMCHPLFKLLIPHIRHTLQTNAEAREKLIAPGGVFDTSVGIGVKGFRELITRVMQSLTYTSFCLPEDLQSRCIESLPKFYYKDDGLKIWSAIQSFVSSIVDCYYKSDESLMKDPELQDWVSEIHKAGFLGNTSSGVPCSLASRAELIKYLTMVIFTCSAQHAAVTNGQFDFLSWMPNAPSTMHQPPLTTKGTATMERILKTVPNVGITTNVMRIVSDVTRDPGHRDPLGTYPEEYFTEEEPKRCMETFQEHLSEISAEIDRRNESLPLKYPYLNPTAIDNSVSK